MLKYALEDFFHYLQIEMGLAENTLTAYKRDLDRYQRFIMSVQQKEEWTQVGRTDIIAFLHLLKDQGKSAATLSRHLSSIRSFHQFLVREQLAETDATLHIETPKKDRKLPDILSVSDIDTLLNISGNSPLNLRNKAMLELLYATGLRVSELITLKVTEDRKSVV